MGLDTQRHNDERSDAPEVSHEEVAAIRSYVRAELAAAQRRSERSGKPLLIMVGEDHVSPHAALLDMVIYQEARAIGVRDLGLELSADDHQGVVDYRFSRLGGLGLGHSLLYRQAQQFGDRVHWVDGLHDELVSEMAKLETGRGNPRLAQHLFLDGRNINMAANLGNIRRPALMLMGAAHLDGIAGDPTLRRSHEVVAFDVADYDSARTNNFPRIHDLQLRGDASKTTLDRLIDLGMGPLQGPAFSRWAENMGFKLGHRGAARSMLEAEATLRRNPNDVAANVAMATALYEYGRDEQAGIHLGRARGECSKTAVHNAMPETCNAAYLEGMGAVVTHTTAFLRSYEQEFTRSLMPGVRGVTGGRVATVATPESLTEARRIARTPSLGDRIGHAVGDATKAAGHAIDEAVDTGREILSNLVPPFLRPRPRPAQQQAPERH